MDLPRKSIVSVEVLEYELKREKSEIELGNNARLEMELNTGTNPIMVVSYEVSVFTMKMEILLEPTSNKLMVDSILQLELPVKKILLKLNLLITVDPLGLKAIFKDGGGDFRYSDTARLSRSDEVLKLKNFKKDATLKLSKSSNQEWYEHVGPEVASPQDGKVTRWRRDYYLNSSYCLQCALIRKKLEEVFQDFQDTSELSNDNPNVVNVPQEPFVFNQDPGENSSQSPPHIDHHCCYECGDSLDDIFCQRCTCKSCGNGAHYGYNCPPKVPIISNPEPCNNQTVDELPQTLPSFDPTCYSGDGNSFTYDSTPNFVNDSPNVFNPPLQPKYVP
ncbi:hypothetical protein Tco_1022840 [Tanacetum coccineum]